MDSTSSRNIEGIPLIRLISDEDNVFRNVHCASYKKWTPKRRPNEADFNFGSDGLSVNWEKYCSLEGVFILLGLQKNKKGEYRNPREFKVIKFNVGELRNIKLLNGVKVDVRHNPVSGNYAHSLVCCEDQDEIRLKLCDMVESFEPPLITPDYEKVERELGNRRQQKEIGKR